MQRIIGGIMAVCTSLVLMAGCSPCPGFGDDPDKVPPYVDIQSMQVEAKGEKFTNSYQSGFPFEVSYSGTYYAFIRNNANFSFPFFTTAKACPPKEPKGYKGSKEKLDSIRIQTIFNFNDSIRKGHVINDRFYVDRLSDSFSSISKFLSSGETQLNQPVSLYLTKQPDTSLLKCAFWFRLENGETYRDTSRTIQVE